MEIRFLTKFFNSKQVLNHVSGEDLFVEITDKERNDLQKILLEMYDDVRSICDQNHLTEIGRAHV